MTTPKQPARSIAILKLPHPVPALIGVAKAIVQAMTGNAMFPNPDPTLATVTVAINDLDASETVAKTRAHGAVAIRNDKRTTLVRLLEQLRAYVQKVADANPETSGSVIQSAGIGVKKPFLRGKNVFAARPGPVTGAVKLTADVVARRAAYEWQSSADGGKTWVDLPGTLQSKTIVTGLTPGATVSFRYRALTRTGEGEWSQPISYLVK